MSALLPKAFSYMNSTPIHPSRPSLRAAYSRKPSLTTSHTDLELSSLPIIVRGLFGQILPSHIQGREVLSLQLNCKPPITDCVLMSPQIHKLKLIPSVMCLEIGHSGGH